MPRKQLLYTHEFPYHIVARSNNKEWFYLSQESCWKIFVQLLDEVGQRFFFKTHAFVLMRNHYHLVGSADERHPLYKVMEWFQRSATRRINTKARRINHLFGGPYRGSLIASESYYLQGIKYVYQNPVAAGLVTRVEEFPFSTISNIGSYPQPKICRPPYGIDTYVKTDPIEIRNE